MKRTGPTNPYIQELVRLLKTASIKENVSIWKRVATDLEKPTRQRRIINLYAIDRYAKDNEIIVVPGKVLSVGEVKKPITIAALSFSGQAMEKLNANKIKTLSINELVSANPKGKNVRIMG